MADTIAAVATGGGVSAVGIIRVSGDGAIAAVDKVFRPKSGIRMSQAEDRRLVLGELLDDKGRVIDVCLCAVSRGPRSYTGEDTAEIHCHGSPVVLSEGLRALFAAGARQAEPGEFTKRAFLSGRMDLSQAEAVIDLIEAETSEAAINAAGQLSGAVRRRADDVYGALADIAARISAELDYPDDDIGEGVGALCGQALSKAERELGDLLGTFERGRVLKDGVATAIIGRPNAGKSSLLNALLGYERAIVTPIPGTTRDTLEEKAKVGGVMLRLIDTAGLRRAEDEVERIGVERARRAAKDAQLVLAVFDGHSELDGTDGEVVEAAARAPRAIAVVNKLDLGIREDTAGRLKEAFERVVPVSAKTGEGIDALVREVEKIFAGADVRPAGEILTNIRQADAVARALSAVREAKSALEGGMTPDVVLTEVESAMAAVGEVTGRTVKDDIISRIFERFCVGK